MKIIETKSVIIEGIDLEKFTFLTKKNENEYFKMMDKIHAILIEHSGGFWDILRTDQKDVWEFVLEPLSDDIKQAGYNWKEYQQFKIETNRARMYGTTPVGFRYKG
jgi:hypothetical protein